MKKPSYTEYFMTFWEAYPKLKRIVNGKVIWKRIGKAEAAVVWEYMTAEEKRYAIYSVQFEEKGDYNLEAAKWLAKRRYEDMDMPEEEGQHLPAEMTNTIKLVQSVDVNVNNRRNEQMRKLKGD